MGNSGKGRKESPLEAAAGAANPTTTAAFKQLANETRLAILLALWEAYEPFADRGEQSFSELRARVGMRDKGQFRYHLDQLVDNFVESGDDGYVLQNAGRKIVRTIIAGTGLNDETLNRTRIDRNCPYCDAPTAVVYQNGWLFQVCTACSGTFGEHYDFPTGTLTVWPLDSAGLTNRTPAEMFTAGAIATMQEYAMMIGGVCPECSGSVDAWFDVCDYHDTRERSVCPACERRYPIQARFVCTICKNKMWGPPSILVVTHPEVIVFFTDHSVEFGYETSDIGGVGRVLDVIRKYDIAELVTTDPVRVAVVYRCNGDELRVTLDESVSVLAVDADD